MLECVRNHFSGFKEPLSKCSNYDSIDIAYRLENKKTPLRLKGLYALFLTEDIESKFEII